MTEGYLHVKLFKLLTVPAVLLFTALMAVPASAHHVTEVVLTQTCNSENGKICVQLTGNIQPQTDVRIVTLQLVGHSGTDTKKVGEATITVPENHGNKPIPFDSGVVCFAAVGGTFDSFDLVWVKVTNKEGGNADLTTA